MDIQTGMLRHDIELIKPGIHGDYAMLFDPGADAYYKISAKSLEIISRIDKSYPLEDFLERLNLSGMDVTKDELLELISFLYQSNLIAPEYGQIEKKIEKYRKMRSDTVFLRLTAAYLFFKLPPVRPEKFLTAIRPYVSWLASRTFVITLLIPALIGYIMLFRNFSEVFAQFQDTLSWAGLAKYFVAIVILKFVHEAAHTISATHFKCRVRGIGLGFMVFYPRLFTDTTDSWRLPRSQRLLIDASGIIIELMVGGIAALLWCYTPPGELRSTLFYIFAVSTISTIFVNGNPCIRYDGYYILCDLVNVENLMTRSSEYIKQCWRWYCLRLGTSPKSDRPYLLFIFGVCSFIYRIFLYTSIILIIYNMFTPAIAYVLVVLELYSIVIYPFYREFVTIRALSKRSASKAGLILFIAAGGFTALLLFMPLSWNVTLPGEVLPAYTDQISVLEGGYLETKYPEEPTEFAKGDIIYKLSSPFLHTSLQKMEKEYSYTEALLNLQKSDKQSLGNTNISLKKLESTALNIAEMKRRISELERKSSQSGLFIPKLHKVSKGIYFPKGLVLGELVSDDRIVYAYAVDRELSKIEPGSEVFIYTRDKIDKYKGTVREINPIPAKLKNSTLLQHYGGPVPVYIDEKKPGEYSSVLALYRVTIVSDEPLPLQFGRIVKAEVVHESRLYDTVSRYLISVFRKEF